MSSTSNLALGAFATAQAANELLDQYLIEELEDYGFETELPVEAPVQTSRIRGIIGVLPALTVAYAGLTVATAAPTERTYAMFRPAPTGLIEWPNRKVKYYSASASSDSVSALVPTVADQIVSELEKVTDGWAGEGSIGPSSRTISEIDLALNSLPHEAVMPAIEVDEDDGSVSLRWINAAGDASYSLGFRGDGRVIGARSTLNPPRSFPWTADVGEDTKIATALEEPSVFDIIRSA